MKMISKANRARKNVFHIQEHFNSYFCDDPVTILRQMCKSFVMAAIENDGAWDQDGEQRPGLR